MGLQHVIWNTNGIRGVNPVVKNSISLRSCLSGRWFGTSFFPYIGNVILPTDELNHFSEV